MNNWLGLFICFFYVFAAIGLAEGLRHRYGYSSDFTRKVIHISVGMMSWLVPFLFDSPWFFVVAALSFAAINLLDWRYGFFAAMVSSDRSNLGTVYFPLAAAAVVIFFWEQPRLLVAALMPLTWGDGLAPVVGRAVGRNGYSIFGSHRTLEGSAGFVLAASLFAWLALSLVTGSPAINPAAALLPALVLGFVTALVEAVSTWGLDNVSITVAAVLILNAWPF